MAEALVMEYDSGGIGEDINCQHAPLGSTSFDRSQRGWQRSQDPMTEGACVAGSQLDTWACRSELLDLPLHFAHRVFVQLSPLL